MAAWSGFTDEDLRKMRNIPQENDDEDRRGATPKRGMARRPRGSAAHQSPRQRNDRPHTTTPSPAPSTSTQAQTLNRIGDDQRLSANKSRNATVVKDGKEIMFGDGEKTKKNDGIKTETAASSSSMPAAVQSPETDGIFSQEATPKSEVVELDTDQVLSKERDNVVKFQQQQKVIEEANKQKRALLSKAIEERRKMAKAEANKLVKIQQELNHLDTLLNADVGIIRDKIEIASLDYAAAQKRYERLEKEFIEAKMDLFAKSETKESLTEHLYTIINQNEVRKAKKLVELMEQLAMQISPEEMELSMPIIPQLTNFTAASTIHQPGTAAAAAHPDGAGGRGSTTSQGHQGLTDAESTAEDGGSSGSVVGGGGTGAKPNSGSEETNSAMGRDEQGGGGGELKSSGNKEEKMSGDEMRKVSENHEDSAKSNPQQPQHLENNNNNNHESSQGCDKELSNTVDKQTAVVTTRQSENENLKPQVQNSNDATVVLKNKSAGDSLTNNNNIQPTTTMTTTTMPAVVVQPSQSPSSENPAWTGPSDSPSPPKDTTKAKGWSLPFT